MRGRSGVGSKVRGELQDELCGEEDGELITETVQVWEVWGKWAWG